MFFDKVFAPFAWLHRGLEIVMAQLRLELLIPPFVTVLSWFGLAKKLRQPQSFDTDRTRVLWDAARQRHIDLYHVAVLGKPTSIFVANFQGKKIVYTHEPRPVGPPSPSYDWMDNKSTMIGKFQAAGIPVPKGSACHTVEEALDAFHKIGRAVIAKPVIGSRSRHTITNITTEGELIHAFKVAQEISPWVIIEQQLEGLVYRATVIGGKVVGVLRREPAHVRGDGQQSVKQLIIEENKNPLRHGTTFHPLLMDLAAKLELKRQGLTWDSVPKAGQMVVLNSKVGRGEGASNTDVTDETHPDNIKLFEQIGSFLGDPLVGIDFIICDIARPWTEQKNCGVIECNAMPFIDLHHNPLRGQPRDAAGALWDIVFPASRLRQPLPH
jgi:D-alanine-D-alanine ligase-like ATP-grasp enzyme